MGQDQRREDRNCWRQGWWLSSARSSAAVCVVSLEPEAMWGGLRRMYGGGDVGRGEML